MAVEPFTLIIGTRDGTGYYKIDSSKLGPITTGSTPELDEMKKRLIDAMHIADAAPPPGTAAPLFFGTFYLNLSVFK